MTFKIGFEAGAATEPAEIVNRVNERKEAPRRSVVQVYFAERNMTLAYYNDQFDLRCGDYVYVDGKLEGIRGRVTEINYNFKIRLSDYKKVIAVVDTSVKGQFYMAGSHCVTFDREALPCSKVRTWYMAPENEEDEYVSGSDDTSFDLGSLEGIGVSAVIAERGYNYYMENRVRFLCIDGVKGYAIVEGREAYELEFEYRDGEISGLVCSCFCSYNCKHEFAVMLQLKETLEFIRRNYADEFERTEYFAAVNKAALFTFAVNSREIGTFTL